MRRPVKSLILLLLPAAAAATTTMPARGQDAEGLIDEPARIQADVAARGVPRVDLVRTAEKSITIDGVLDEPAWADATVIEDFRQVEPVEGAEPSERTEVRLLFDRDFLYVAFRCYDDEPDKIIATQMRREGSLDPDDRVSFVVDPFFDRRNGFFFQMNAVGARTDALIEDNERFRADWDGIWYGRASIDEQGWVAEMAIPFKTLSFNPDTTQWSFNATRLIRRRNEVVRWAAVSQNKSISSIADAGVLEGIFDIDQGLGLDFKPYALATAKRDSERDRSGLDVDAGFDIFYKLSPSTTLALTVNTDFAETEVDERRVNLTRFPLFFPEKRDFFLQDAGIFDFGGIRRNPLPFFSRRIGIGPDGEPRDILAGVKLTGRDGALNFGLLDVQMKHDDELGDKNLFVGRASVNVLDESAVGVIATHGDPATENENWVVGADFNFRDSTFNGDQIVEGNLWYLQSDSSNATGQRNAAGFKLGYPNDRIDWEIGASQIDDQFNAALGFVPRPGIREYFANWRYRWRPDSDLIRSIDAGVRGMYVTNLDDETESRELEFDLFELQTEAGDQFFVGFEREREVLFEPFEISEGVVIPVGDYKYDRYRLGLFTSEGRPVNIGLFHGGGDFFSGTRDTYEASFGWRPSRHLTLGAEFELNDVKLDEGDFITRLVRGRVNVYFTPDLSWTNFVQFDNQSETVGINSRVRWIVEPGNEVFFVVNQAIERDGSSYRVLQTELTTKVGWTFRF
ncbi:MAG: DUF5916 domain-containing protein [Planctomycetota bacterium]